MTRSSHPFLLAVVLLAAACGSTDATAGGADSSVDGSVDGSASDVHGDAIVDTTPPDLGICPPYPDAGPAPSDCTTCVGTLCKAEENACAAEDACQKQTTCQRACTTVACQQACATTFPSAAGDALFVCIRCRCTAACVKTT